MKQKKGIVGMLEKKKSAFNLEIIVEFICCLFLFMKTAFSGILDTDVFYLLAVGKDILKHGIPYINTLITTANTPVVLQNWAYCALLAFIEKIAGSIGLYCFMIMLLSGLYLVIRKSIHNTIKNKWIVFLSAFTLTNMFTYLNLRPEIFTFLLVYLEIYGIRQYDRTDKKLFLLYIPLSMVFEINFHASYWILHYIVILPFIVPLIDDKIRQTVLLGEKRKYVLITAALSFGILFLNPYGVHNITYVFKAYFSEAFKAVQIVELSPIKINNVLYVPLFLISILLFTYGMWEQHNPPYLSSTAVWMWLGFFVLTISKIKWIPFFVLGFLFLFQDMGSVLEQWILKVISNIHIKKNIQYLLYFIIICGFTLYISLSDNNTRQIKLLCNNESLTTLYFSQKQEFKYADEWKEVIEIVKKNPNGVFCIPCTYNHLFSYEDIPVYFDMRPELYTKKDNNGISILDRAAMILNMKKRNNEIEDDVYLTKKEYASLVHDINANYFLITEEGQGSLLNLYLADHPDFFNVLYSKNGTILYERR